MTDLQIVRLAGDLLAAVEVAESLRIPGSSFPDTAGSFLGISEEDFEASVMERYSNVMHRLLHHFTVLIFLLMAPCRINK